MNQQQIEIAFNDVLLSVPEVGERIALMNSIGLVTDGRINEVEPAHLEALRQAGLLDESNSFSQEVMAVARSAGLTFE